uniref:Uncharacterized protein n=1 Tax=Oryza glaberrima TaxID=4538 RepID=I1PLI3_ORYGL
RECPSTPLPFFSLQPTCGPAHSVVLLLSPTLNVGRPFFLCPLPQSGSLSISPVSAVSTGKCGRSPSLPSPVISEGRDVEDADPNLPGFFKNPSRLSDNEIGEDGLPLAAEPDGFLGHDEGGDAPSEFDIAAELDDLDIA